MIFDSYKVDFDELYKYADNKTLKRIKTQIEEWREIKDDYLKNLANSIYRRNRVKNSEILFLLIYEAYIEEQNKMQDEEQKIMKEDINHYYIEGQKEASKLKPPKKIVPITDTVFFNLLGMVGAQGYIWSEYIKQLERYNAEQIYRQMAINLQQNRPNNINDNIYQNLFKSQLNSKIKINGDKVSGALDIQLIGMNNKAKAEGMARVDKDSKVMFIAVEDKVTTLMCHSLDGQIFKVNGLNEFNRYYGADSKNLRITKIKCDGLVLGLNLPPINHHFHWCRSTIIYNINYKNKELIALYNEVKKISKYINVEVPETIEKFADFRYNKKGYIDNIYLKKEAYNEYKNQIIIGEKQVSFEDFYNVYNQRNQLENIKTKEGLQTGKIQPHTIYRMAGRNISVKDVRNALENGTREIDIKNNSFLYTNDNHIYVAIADDANHNIKTVFKRRNK